jgi:hypothetical protein
MEWDWKSIECLSLLSRYPAWGLHAADRRPLMIAAWLRRGVCNQVSGQQLSCVQPIDATRLTDALAPVSQFGTREKSFIIGVFSRSIGWAWVAYRKRRAPPPCHSLKFNRPLLGSKPYRSVTDLCARSVQFA